MDKDKQLFTPEKVDDEIDQLINTSASAPLDLDTRFVRQLRYIYKEEADSLKQVWERLECYSMQQHTSPELHQETAQRQAAGYYILPIQKNTSSAKYPARQLFIPLAATFIGIFLIGSLAWALVMTHSPGRPSAQQQTSQSGIYVDNLGLSVRNQRQQASQSGIIAIRMLNQMHGWALTGYSILKTSDGGVHWQDVTPANASPTLMSKGNFMNDQYAWVVTPQEMQNSISVLRTTDGGKSWQSSTIQTSLAAGTDMPHFPNLSDGWLQTFGEPGAGHLPSAIFRTTDGGQHWTQLPSANQGSVVRASGISFSDTQNGWETGDGGAGAVNPAQPLLDVTHDGGQTWHSVQLPALPGVGKDEMVETTPPVMFGNDGLLPVQDSSQSRPGTNLYVTHDGGQSWSPTTFVNINPIAYVVNPQHAWAAGGANIYATGDGGRSWTKLPPISENINALSFTDPNNGWAIATTSNIYNPQPHLLHTTNGGHSWQQINYSIQ